MNYNAQTKGQTNLLYSFKFWLLTLLLILFYSVILIGQNVVYLDPTNTSDPSQNGSFSHPFDNWDQDIVWQDNTTYLQKRGTTITNNSPITVEFKENITIGAYGDGPKPIIRYTGTNSDIIYISCSSNCTLEGIELEGDIYSTRSGVHIAGYWAAIGEVSNDTKIINCDIHDVYNGVRALEYATNIDTIGIYNSSIYNCMSDGCYITDADSVNIINTHIYRVNMGWHLVEGGQSQNVSAGDCIQLGGVVSTFTVRGCTLDRRFTGNKFCLIYNTGGQLTTGRGLVEWNTFYPPKDTIGDDGGSCLYLKHAYKISVKHNKFIARDYPGGSDNGGSLAHFEVDTIEYAYNMTDNVENASFSLGVDYATISNNTFVNANGTNNIIYLNGTTCVAQNNVFALNSGMNAIYNNYGNLTEISNHIVYGNSSNWGVDPGFVDWQNQNFRLKESSSCTNGGTNYSTYIYDLDSISVPQGGCRDIGAFEYTDGSQSTNNAPLIDNQVFSVPENSSNSTLVATVVASDPDAGQSLTYSITGGNTSNAFSINSATGQLSVNNTSALNFEQTPSFALIVTVQDNDISPLSSSATITVNLTDINEVPNINNQAFSVAENTANGQAVGTVIATDPDNGQSLSYQILSGNSSGAFNLNTSSGQITVANSAALNFESTPIFALIVKVTDNGAGSLTDQASVTINLTDVNEAPDIYNQGFGVAENTPNGQTVGTVIATDPDNGQYLSFSILSGNTGNAFNLNATSGIITISNSVALNFESTPVFSLIVKVTDNGVGLLSDQATVTINLTDVNEFPGMVGQGFTLNENSLSGILVGQVLASDPDVGQSLVFSIQNGNSDNAFTLNSSTGVINVNNEAAINFETNPEFILTVRATDNGTGNLWTEAQMIIDLIDLNEAPVIVPQDYSVDINGSLFSVGNQNNQIFVGNIIASDPDAGQALSYRIIKCSDNELWTLDENSGVLEILDPCKLNPVEIHNYEITIEVSDNNISPIAVTSEFVVHVNISNVDAFNDYLESLNTGVNNSVVSNTFSINPNPASNQIRITMDLLQEEPVMVSIYAMNGNRVLDKTYDGIDRTFNETLQLNGLKTGLYMLSVQQGEKIQTSKLIKQ